MACRRKPEVDAPLPFRQQLLGAIPRLRRYARTLVFDTHAADDVVQATLERALAHWHRFDQSRDILVWLMSIAHNAHIDELRRSARMRPASAAEQDGLDALAAAPGHDPGLRLDLLAALRRLPPEQCEPLLLVTLEQFSYAECAQILRIPIGTVMSRISRGRCALRALLEEPAQPPAAVLRRVV